MTGLTEDQFTDVKDNYLYYTKHKIKCLKGKQRQSCPLQLTDSPHPLTPALCG